MSPGIARYAAAALLAVAGVWVGASFVSNVRATRSAVESESDPNVYAGAARWMRENTEEGSLVFNTDWDDFPMLFYHDTHNVYVTGLDPTYLLHTDPERSKLFEEITLGREPDPAALIRDRFGARYAFTDSGHGDFIANATTDGHMKVVYQDDKAVVLAMGDVP